MNSRRRATFDRWWWRAWGGLSLFAVIWLAAGAWLARPAAPWALGWAGWWTGDHSGGQPLRNLGGPHLSFAAEIIAVEGNPAIRTTAHSWAGLGHLGLRQYQLTLAGWKRVLMPQDTWPESFLVVQMAEADPVRLQLGFMGGHPCLLTQFRDTNGTWSKGVELRSAERAPMGKWLHLSMTTDGNFIRLLVDGRSVAEARSYHDYLSLGRLELCSRIFDPEGIREVNHPGATVEHDDTVVYDRVVPPEELLQMTAGGRGAWAREIGRPAQARRIWNGGWPTVLVLWTVAVGLRLWPGRTRRLASLAVLVIQPAYRPIRWVLLAGTVASALLAGALERQGRRADEARFAELMTRLLSESDGHWEQLDLLLIRAREWLTVHPRATNADWIAWLELQHFPADYPGVLGLGFAQQVLPEQVQAHEAEWSARHGFAYRVQPESSTPRVPGRQLAGDPRLPVVLYAPQSLSFKHDRWFSNHTILGRDLLFQATNDPRAWSQAKRIEASLVENQALTSSLEEIAPAAWYGGSVTGLRLYVPWVIRPRTGDQEQLAPEAWRGVVFASVNLQEQVLDRLNLSPPLMGFRLSTGERDGPRFDVVLDTGILMPTTAERPGAGLRKSLQIEFFHHSLWLDLWTTELFEAQSLRRWPWIAGSTGIGVTLLMTLLLFVQVRARERQAAIAQKLQVAYGELSRVQHERATLSRDLHDGTIQNLYAVGLHLQHAQRHLPATAEKTGQGLEESQRLVQETIVELREFLLSLKDERVAGQTFAETVQELFFRLRRTTPVEFELAVDPAAAALPSRSAVQLVNLVREAVSNALRHGNPRRVAVSLRCERGTAILESPHGNDRWRLAVQDDGCGFDPAKVDGDGFGLRTMRERAAELGGTLNLQSAPGTGTTVNVEFATREPVEEPATPNHI